jgi:hypothetical protein
MPHDIRLGHGPAATPKLPSKLFGRHAPHRVLKAGQHFCWGGDKGCPVELGVLQTVDKHCRLVAGELAGGLALCEPQWATSLAEVGMAGALKEGQQLFHLPR